jgi:hypothetical protein
MKLKTLLGLSAIGAVLTLGARDSLAQLDGIYREHGGLERWRFFAAVEYDLTWQTGDKPARKEHQLIELSNRRILITSDSYSLGFDGKDCWVAPNLAAFQGPPARFWVSTPFYFFSIPFVFADPGAKVEHVGNKIFRGRETDMFKVTYGKGVGDTPDDDYVLYVDRASRRIVLVHYIVTYPALRNGKSIDQLERHALFYDEWQEADRMVVPKRGSLYVWEGDDLKGDPIGKVAFDNVRFRRVPTSPKQFEAPKVAEVDRSLGK